MVLLGYKAKEKVILDWGQRLVSLSLNNFYFFKPSSTIRSIYNYLIGVGKINTTFQAF